MLHLLPLGYVSRLNKKDRCWATKTVASTHSDRKATTNRGQKANPLAQTSSIIIDSTSIYYIRYFAITKAEVAPILVGTQSSKRGKR